MIIAVNTRLQKETQPAGYEDFLFGILNQLNSSYPQHQFLYIFDKPYAGKLPFPKNVLQITAGPETRSRLRLQYWYNYRLPAVLRKYKADVFISMEGICSMRTGIPQCLLFTDLAFLQSPLLIKKSWSRFYKKYTPSFIEKVKAMAVLSDFSRTALADTYKLNEADIKVINPAVNSIFRPIDWQAAALVKEKYAEGKAYFIFSGNIDQRSNLINLLKAFTFFKQRQKSNMLLLIAGNADETFKKELKTYKLRHEVRLLENLSETELAKITAAAYAMVYPVLYTDFALPALQALQSGVPAIVSDTGALQSLFGAAAWYIQPDDHKEIAEKMMLVFKDEDKARELIHAGNKLIKQYRLDKSADLMMQLINQALHH